MIRYALTCARGHEFEAWFRNSGDFDLQAERGLVECPACGAVEVKKQIMAPAVRTSRKQLESTHAAPMNSETGAACANGDFESVARQVRAHIRSNFDYVGDRFATEARAIHQGEKPHRMIYGETSPQERKQLEAEGVPCAPLPPAFAPVPPKKAH